MEFIKKNLYKLILMAFLIVTPILSFAVTGDTPSDPNAGKIVNPLGPNGAKDLPTFIHNFLTGVLRVGIPIVALAIIYCGFLFVKARGKSEELTKAKDALLYTLIGAAILLGSYAIATMISGTVLAL